MSGFKTSQPGLAFSGEQISSDEIDRYEVYTIVQPDAVSTQWFGTTALGSASSSKAFVVINAIADYPRNIQLGVGYTGSAAVCVGTATINGKDQFGNVISETITIADSGTNQGTAQGTKVFAQFTSGTFSFGTLAVAGTPKLGVVVGTNCLFGLPVKLQGTGDVVLMGRHVGSGAITVGGGTIGAFVDVGMSAVRSSATVTGTEMINVWVKPSYNPTGNIAKVANLKQV